MAITQMSRTQLNQAFRDGERPSGDDFASAWMSFVNKTDDGISIDANGNVELSKGITVKDATGGQAGTLRFNGGQLQYHDGTSFKNVSSGAGAFTPVAGGPSVAFAGGNVGIGNFAAAPSFRLEIKLGDNTGTDQQVKMGNLVVHDGSAAAPGAYVCHSSQATDSNFALFQDSQGNTTVNAALNTQLILSQGVSTRFRVLVSGAIELDPVTTVTINGNTAIGNPVVPKDLTVFGNAFKPGGGPFNPLVSDSRVKKDVRLFTEGLEKITALKPVFFKFNGKAETIVDGKDYIGFIAQDLQKILPELITSHSLKLEPNDKEETEILSYDQGPLTFLMINAIKELAARFDTLEKSKTNEKRKPKNTTRANA